MTEYIYYFLTPLFIGIVALFLLIKFFEKTNFLADIAKGDELKIHKKPTPLLGGLGMAIAVFSGLLLFISNNNLGKVIALLSGGGIIFLVMFWDDLKWKHISARKPLLKFLILILSTIIPAIILASAGISFNFIPVPVIAVLLGSVFIFTVVNSINYQDGMDGLAGGLVFISLAGFLCLGLLWSIPFVVLVCLVALGAVLSFLIFNFPPAKIFMGDSGAYSLGFLLTAIALIFSKPLNIYSVLGPVFIIGLPIFDGVFTNMRRVVNGKSIFLGDRSHFYDRLMQKGFSVKKTLLVCYLLQFVSVVLGILLYSYA